MYQQYLFDCSKSNQLNLPKTIFSSNDKSSITKMINKRKKKKIRKNKKILDEKS